MYVCHLSELDESHVTCDYKINAVFDTRLHQWRVTAFAEHSQVCEAGSSSGKRNKGFVSQRTLLHAATPHTAAATAKWGEGGSAVRKGASSELDAVPSRNVTYNALRAAKAALRGSQVEDCGCVVKARARTSPARPCACGQVGGAHGLGGSLSPGPVRSGL
jgi:hypothetical protein